MKNKICLLLYLFIFSSCNPPDSKFVDLSKIPDNFDVSGFYQNKVKKTNEIIWTKPNTPDKKSALKHLDNAFLSKIL